MNLPKIESYGEYKVGNYGLNSLQVSFPNGLSLFFSYTTIMAFRGREGLKVRENEWSNTTGKHLNWIDGGDKKSRLAGAEFEKLLNAELEYYGLGAQQ